VLKAACYIQFVIAIRFQYGPYTTGLSKVLKPGPTLW